ncbi:MAG TPA: putative quinol monooxygenase [Alphaproteobacteria bacterium]
MPELTLTVRMTAKPERGKDLESALRAVVAPTHAEAGCIRYALHRSVQDENVFFMVERWTSKAALEQHLAQPYLKTMLAMLPELVQSSEFGEYEMLVDGVPNKPLYAQVREI